MEPKQRQFSVRYSVIAIVALLLIEGYVFAPRPETLAYSDFVKLSTGAANDLQRGTDMARHMVTQYSMSDKLGLATFEEPRPTFLGLGGVTSREYSGATAETIDVEIAAIPDAAHRRVGETLAANRPTLEALAKLLLDKEVVTADTLRALLRDPAGTQSQYRIS